MRVLDRIIVFCADQYGCDPEDMTLSATLRELNLTRDDLAELTAALEDQFEIPIPDEVLDEAETLEDLVGYIEDRL